MQKTNQSQNQNELNLFWPQSPETHRDQYRLDLCSIRHNTNNFQTKRRETSINVKLYRIYVLLNSKCKITNRRSSFCLQQLLKIRQIFPDHSLNCILLAATIKLFYIRRFKKPTFTLTVTYIYKIALAHNS